MNYMMPEEVSSLPKVTQLVSLRSESSYSIPQIYLTIIVLQNPFLSVTSHGINVPKDTDLEMLSRENKRREFSGVCCRTVCNFPLWKHGIPAALKMGLHSHLRNQIYSADGQNSAF